MSKRNDTVVLGLGNPLMADEGVGSFLVGKLLEKADSFPDIDFIDAGTGGMAVLHLIAKRKKVIIIDCAYMNEPPGTMVRFTPQDVKTVKKLLHYSLHEIDILKVIKFARQIEQCPDDIVFFAIEPKKIELQDDLTPDLLTKIDEYLEAIEAELRS
jgi:hydrogenase maturation protease